MNQTLRVLHIEDSEKDVALLRRYLTGAGYDVVSERVQTADGTKLALETSEWDVVLCDYSMPQFNAIIALDILKTAGLDIPFIIISGSIGEALAVEAMRAGAHDYVMKDNLLRLNAIIERERQEAENRRARRAAEEQLRLQSAALEAAANAIVITDRNGTIIWVNTAFTETSGFSFEDVRGNTPRLLKSGKQDESFYRNMWQTILAGNVWHNTVINRRKDGTFIPEDLTITPIRNDEGTITHFVGIKQDITELERALSEVQQKKEELTTMTQQLWQASKLATMGELAASIAHELNNPLATVALRAETLLMQLPEDSENRKPLQIISQEVDRMANLVGNLLQFSRRSHRQISTIDLREEIENSLELVRYHLRTRNVDVIREFADSLPTIQADRQQLRQLFLNLLTNATDAMPQGGKLTVRARPNSVLRKAVAIEFADTGEGISEKDLQKIWDPFFTTKAEGKGTGLGLAICRRIVEEHGGTIDIHSEPGVETTVRISLPTSATEHH